MCSRVSLTSILISVSLVSQAAGGGQGVNNLNPQNSLCLDLRGVSADGAQGGCQSADAECPVPPPPFGPLQCTDDDLDPLNGGICVERGCYSLGESVVVDIELGPTTGPACGAQIFLGWDTAALVFDDLQIDPDAEMGWSKILLQNIDFKTGRISLAAALPVGTSCDDVNGSLNGGTIARLTFTAVQECTTSGVFFVANNPPTSVSGPDGGLDIVGCNGAAVPSNVDAMSVSASPPVWVCPESSSGDAACPTNTREVLFPPISVTGSCGQIMDPITDLCTVQFFPACTDDGDCEGVSTCIDGTCDAPVVPVGIVLTDYLGGGGDFLPGRTEFRCSASDGCGAVGTCEFDVVNTGLNRIVVNVEMSPTMVSGAPNAPIIRCIDFALSDCDDTNQQTFSFSQEVAFGAPGNVPGHGTAAALIPSANWSCLNAIDPMHSLNSTCTVACVDGDWRTTFKGPPENGPLCHWLIQGNLDGSPFIDIFDFTILAGQYLTAPGAVTTCSDVGPHADLNGDGIVTLADFSFIITNFLVSSQDLCADVCGTPLVAPKTAAR